MRSIGTTGASRQVAVVNAQKKHKTKEGTKPRVHGGHYMAQDYQALTNNKQAQVRALRDAAKAKKLKTSATSTSLYDSAPSPLDAKSKQGGLCCKCVWRQWQLSLIYSIEAYTSCCCAV